MAVRRALGDGRGVMGIGKVGVWLWAWPVADAAETTPKKNI